VNGPADRRPRAHAVYPDYMTGLFTAFGVMARSATGATGEGQWIDARSRVGLRVMEFTATPTAAGHVREPAACSTRLAGGAFETQDGSGSFTARPAPVRSSLRDIGSPTPAMRFASARRGPSTFLILDLMTEWFAARPFEKALAELKGADIPHSPIMSMATSSPTDTARAR